jgi:hypothetical protein
VEESMEKDIATVINIEVEESMEKDIEKDTATVINIEIKVSMEDDINMERTISMVRNTQVEADMYMDIIMGTNMDISPAI